ncbi:MAG: PIG-L family deacetylase [Polyangiales bacterium]
MADADLTELLTELFGAAAARDAEGPWLVVGAHSDDETIGASWLLARARPLTIVQLTDGAPHDATLWPSTAPPTRAGYASLRRFETEQALAIVGIPPAHIVNLGLADQDATFGIVGAVQALGRLLDELSPRVVITHPYEGGHPDHDAVAVSVRAALAARRVAGQSVPRLIEMTSYHLHEGKIRTGAFLPAPAREAVRALSSEELTRKQRMFACYASQHEVLGWFRIDEERFRAAPVLHLGEPPHAGPLHYETLGFPMRGERFRLLALQALTQLGFDESALL